MSNAATSTIPLVVDALKARWEARAGLAGVQVFDGIPLDPEPEYLWIAEIHGDQKAAAARTPAPSRDEEYDVTVVCRVQWSIDDAKGCRDRVFAILAEVENDTRADGTLGVLGPYSGWAEIKGPMGFIPDLSAEQRIGKLLFTIHVKARI